MDTLCERIKTARKSRRMPQYVAAKKLGYRPETLSRIEHESAGGITVNVKQENKRCPYCQDGETLNSDAGQHDFRIMGDGLFYFDSQLGWEGVTINFCPWCGRDLTREE